MRNHSKAVRRALTCYFCRRDQPQQTDQKQALQPSTKERLSDAALYLLDV